MIGEARFDPKSLADVDTDQPEELTRKSAHVVEITEPILPPPLIPLTTVRKEPTQKRVSLTDEKLMNALTRLFSESDEWKVEEIVEALDHPREPIARMLK